MAARVAITVLVENTVSRPVLKAEHGLAFWIASGSENILFDTGQSDLLTANAKGLGVDLGAVNAIALSHGHYDHCGGLEAALSKATGGVPVYAHPGVLQPRYRRAAGVSRQIGMPDCCMAALLRRKECLRAAAAPVEIAHNVFLTGEIPRVHAEEQADEEFRAGADGRKPDLLPDDQALFMRTPAGTVVFLGCAHSGIINTLEYIRHLTDDRPFHAILGGMHLKSASNDRIAWTIEALRQIPFKQAYPAHCTGAQAAAALWTAFPGRCFAGCVGTAIII